MHLIFYHSKSSIRPHVIHKLKFHTWYYFTTFREYWFTPILIPKKFRYKGHYEHGLPKRTRFYIARKRTFNFFKNWIYTPLYLLSPW